MKFIQELRMGPGKCWKTGAVVSTYPRPLLCLQFDQGGLDVLTETPIWLKPDELLDHCKKKSEELNQNGIYAVDFCDYQKAVMDTYTIAGNPKPFKSYLDCLKALRDVGCPFKTVVNDSLSGITDGILAHMSATNSSAMGSALKWAPMVGGKVHQIMGAVFSLNCHSVFIAHSGEPAKEEETTQEVKVNILAPSQWFRDRAGTLASQFFYQCKEGGKPVLFTNDFGYIKGIGARWPANLPPKIQPPTFQNIYGKA